MFRQKFTTVFWVVLAALATPAFAQSEDSISKQEISVQAFGSFLLTTTQSGIQNKADNTAGVLGRTGISSRITRGSRPITRLRRIQKAMAFRAF